MDSKGLVTKAAKDLAHHKLPYAHETDSVPPSNLLDAVKLIKPTAIIGVSAQGQTFTKEVCEEMNSTDLDLYTLKKQTKKNKMILIKPIIYIYI